MPNISRPLPPALPHGPIREVLPGVHFVTGTVAMPGPLPIRFSRNMTILQEADGLVLVNSVRLDEQGLASLDALGKVRHVIRLAANHGMDDPFYKDRYGAQVWTVKGQRYTTGFDTKSDKVYFTADVEMDGTAPLPIAGARLYTIHSEPPEGLLLIERSGGVCVSGDALQNWQTLDEQFSFLGRGMMRMMGFIRPHNVGPGWLKQCRPPKDELRAILGLGFTHVMPGHGVPVIGDAIEKYRASIERACA